MREALAVAIAMATLALAGGQEGEAARLPNDFSGQSEVFTVF